VRRAPKGDVAKRVHELLHLVRLENLEHRFPSQLSGGQRQRVALARALVGQPRVLILDDSLSSVDAETEQAILSALDQVMAGRTAIVISHRVAAVRRAHQIAVLEAGKLVELGRHDQLLAKGGVYAELYRSQVEKEILA
jgi:ABC-type multidrug transport system fused ATPase/permease subunit